MHKAYAWKSTSCMNSEQNGQRSQDSSRTEGRQEAEGQECLQREARADAGGQTGCRDRIVYVENSSNVRGAFVIQEVRAVEDLIQKVCDKFPAICLDSIGMHVSNSRQGTLHRQVFTDVIPYEYDTLYITLFLRKHPSFSESKIETQRRE